jgi:arabinogalactan endo-1,4-beta-galactosidase
MKRHVVYSLRSLLGLAAFCHCSGETPSPSNGTPASAGSSGDDSRENGATPEDPARVVPTDSSTNGEANPTPTDVAGIAGAPALDPSSPAASGGGSGGAPQVPLVPETPRFDGSFILGADISSIQEAVNNGAAYVDTDGQQKSMLELLKNHGFNYVRLRTFVEPSNEYGYASGSGCQAKAEAYNDRDHTVAFAREVKAAGLGFLLDFHYSDTWADPGKQVIPQAWRGIDSLALMAEQVRTYTVDVVTALVAAGARPDMVQVGNEITPGMLIHVPTATTDCYGNNSVVNPAVNGSQNDWDNLATLLRAGIEGVKQVDPEISIMLHVENTGNVNGVIGWVRNAQSRGVTFDVLGLSAYEAFQGPSTAWAGTLDTLATTFPDLSFSIAEYNPERRLLNDIMRGLPDGRGLGTFFWEPTQSGSWGSSMFTRQGSTLTANPNDFAEYDQLRQDYGL